MDEPNYVIPTEPCGSYCGWTVTSRRKYVADTSIPGFPTEINLLKDGAAKWIWAPLGDFFFAYDVITYTINRISSINQSWGYITTYKNPTKSQYVNLWTVFSSSGYLMSSSFSNVTTTPPKY